MMNSKTIAETLITLSEKEQSEQKLEQFFNYLKSRNLDLLLPQAKVHVNRILERKNRYNTLIIRSEQKLDPQDITVIKEHLTVAKDAMVEEIIDERMVGSFQAQYQGRLYDASLAKSLQNLRQSLNY